jgi:hypothetical protein
VRRAAAVCAVVAAGLIVGCGGVVSSDLFVVERGGSSAHARLTLLVNEEGGVTCNGRQASRLDDPQIIKARDIQEDLLKPAINHLSLPSRAGSVLSYRVRDEHGTVRFSDNSAGQPAVLHELQLFVLQTAQQNCHLPE